MGKATIHPKRLRLTADSQSQQSSSFLLLLLVLTSYNTGNAAQSKAIEDPVQSQRSEEIVDNAAETETTQLKNEVSIRIG